MLRKTQQPVVLLLAQWTSGRADGVSAAWSQHLAVGAETENKNLLSGSDRKLGPEPESNLKVVKPLQELQNHHKMWFPFNSQHFDPSPAALRVLIAETEPQGLRGGSSSDHLHHTASLTYHTLCDMSLCAEGCELTGCRWIFGRWSDVGTSGDEVSCYTVDNERKVSCQRSVCGPVASSVKVCVVHPFSMLRSSRVSRSQSLDTRASPDQQTTNPESPIDFNLSLHVGIGTRNLPAISECSGGRSAETDRKCSSLLSVQVPGNSSSVSLHLGREAPDWRTPVIIHVLEAAEQPTLVPKPEIIPTYGVITGSLSLSLFYYECL
ncbi:unnamed protein product [Pleuronectes platessa]|uniref:Uncharacterized protein n=1 Tax=Pleuronectes platessa TaxID=8262 RepID=A0A9N7YEA3_PLEPL|nr:unnamed protein product [Pleuronectes platessa]